MTEQEKIIKGLGEISAYFRSSVTAMIGGTLACDAFMRYADAAERAIVLLKSQEPRVMTLEEVKSLERDAVVWYEHNGVNKQRPRIVDQVYDSGIIFTDGGHWRFNADAYGKNFRLWTSHPTEAEREAVKWE